MTQVGYRCPGFVNPQNAKFVVDLGKPELSARAPPHNHLIRPMRDIVLSFFSNPSQQWVK